MKSLYIFVLLLFCFGCEFQTKDADLEKLRIESERQASERQSELIRNQTESFERIILQQNETVKASIANRSGVPAIFYFLCGLGIILLLIVEYAILRIHMANNKRNDRVIVIGDMNELKKLTW